MTDYPTEEQQMFADSVRRFAESTLADGAVARAHAHDFPADVVDRLVEMGLIGITIPEADGGVSSRQSRRNDSRRA